MGVGDEAGLLGLSAQEPALVEMKLALVHDLLVRSLLPIGATKRDIARAIGGATTRRAA
jgi:hypothetical protein